MTRLRWSPVASATTWDESLVLARAMTGAARPGGPTWASRPTGSSGAEALLAPLLHAAHLNGSGMETVLRWVLRQDLAPARAILAAHGVETGVDVLSGLAATDPRELSGIWSSTAGVLAAYRSDAVLDNCAAPNFDPRRFVGTADTVYVCAPARYQELVAPIVVAFLEQVRAGAYASAAAAVAGRAAPRSRSPWFSTSWPTSLRSPTCPPW